MQKVMNYFSALSLDAEKYGLSKSDIIVEIENTISDLLSKWYGFDVVAVFQGDCQVIAIGYSNSCGLIQQRNIDLNEIKGIPSIRRAIITNLQKGAVLKQVAQYKKFERELRWGEITTCDYEQNLYVETEVVPGERVTAVCPLNRISIHERDNRKFSIGRKRAFHLRRVEPVLLNSTPRLKVILDRVSKTLVENLLKSQLAMMADKIQIRCVKRYVGHKSIVLTTKPIPKAAIMAVC